MSVRLMVAPSIRATVCRIPLPSQAGVAAHRDFISPSVTENATVLAAPPGMKSLHCRIVRVALTERPLRHTVSQVVGRGGAFEGTPYAPQAKRKEGLHERTGYTQLSDESTIAGHCG